MTIDKKKLVIFNCLVPKQPKKQISRSTFPFHIWSFVNFDFSYFFVFFNFLNTNNINVNSNKKNQ
jgi:hypothetical protein